MQVILLEKIVNLGQLGDVVKVKEGYARNFLIPQGKARRATETAIKEFEGRRAELEKVQADKFAAAQSVQERLNGGKVQVTAKAGVDGRLFGSITNYDIAEALGKQGFDVNKAQVRMPQGPAEAGRRPHDHRCAAFRRHGGYHRHCRRRAGLTPRSDAGSGRGGRHPADGAARGGFLRSLLYSSPFLAGTRPQRTDGIRRAP